MSMTIIHGAVTLTPTSLARDGSEPSDLLETCLAAFSCPPRPTPSS